MKAAFLIGVLWLAYVYAGYPLLLVLLAAWRHARPTASEESLPSVSVLIAARNEEKDIGWKLGETLTWDYPSQKLEILVASDASEDSTDEVVRTFVDPRVILVRMVRRGGKARALNRMAEQARGEVLFFTDANSHIGASALRTMVRHFSDPRVGCVTGNTRFIEERESAAVSVGGGTYLGYETILKRLENRIGSVLVCDGAIFCMRSVLFQRLNPDLANDLELPMRVGARGYWVLHEPEALVLERGTSSPLEEFQRLRRMCAQGTLAMFKLRDLFFGLRGWQFISHKFLRWTSLIPMLMVLASSMFLARNSSFFASLLVLQAIFYGLAAFGWRRAIANRPVLRLIAVPFYVVLGVVGALVGTIDSLRGKRFDVWEIPSLSRGPVGTTSRSAQTSD
jgi:cellulose synthase/poly-beta-1,6-N-acetylglucosamine synthase-like glycosyltransferase